jgi:hypothetical protein
MLCVLSSLVLGVVPCVQWTLSTILPPYSTYLPFLIRKERGFLKLLSKFKPKTKIPVRKVHNYLDPIRHGCSMILSCCILYCYDSWRPSLDNSKKACSMPFYVNNITSAPFVKVINCRSNTVVTVLCYTSCWHGSLVLYFLIRMFVHSKLYIYVLYISLTFYKYYCTRKIYRQFTVHVQVLYIHVVNCILISVYGFFYNWAYRRDFPYFHIFSWSLEFEAVFVSILWNG